MFVSVPRQVLDYQLHMLWVVCYGDRRLFIVLILVELFTIDHCLNFLFIIYFFQI